MIFKTFNNDIDKISAKIESKNIGSIICIYNKDEVILTSRQNQIYNTFFRKTDDENFQYCLQNLQRINTLKLPDKILQDLPRIY